MGIQLGHMSDLYIRKAASGDAALLADLSARTFKSAYKSQLTDKELDDYVASTFSLDRIQAELHDPACKFLLAHDGDTAVGYAMLGTGDPPEGVTGPKPVELARIYLTQDVIGKGYGTMLMEVCLQAARDSGHETIWLGVWEKNDRAIRFYEKWGFSTVGSIAFEFGREVQTDLVMMRSI
jgi:GNAT superfamily N-acetyltransferase